MDVAWIAACALKRKALHRYEIGREPPGSGAVFSRLNFPVGWRIVLLAIFWAVTSWTGPAQSQTQAQTQAAFPNSPPSTAMLQDNYVLGPGDRVRVIVYGEPDLSGEFEIDANGQIALPLVEIITAARQTIGGLEKIITDRLSAYLKNPRVSIQVILYRPFTILGQVKNPGNYPFVPGMTVKNAIGLAGGYTVRGGPGSITIERARSADESEQSASEDTPVNPDDTVRVGNRLF